MSSQTCGDGQPEVKQDLKNPGENVKAKADPASENLENGIVVS